MKPQREPAQSPAPDTAPATAPATTPATKATVPINAQNGTNGEQNEPPGNSTIISADLSTQNTTAAPTPVVKKNPFETTTDWQGRTMVEQQQMNWPRIQQYLSVNGYEVIIDPNWHAGPDLTNRIFQQAIEDPTKSKKNLERYDYARPGTFLYFGSDTCKDFDCAETN